MQVIFDFDCTLSEAMVYDNLGGGSLERARQMRLPWWINQFGGKARLQMLEDVLGRLESLDVSLHLCSHNNTEVIKEALRRVNLIRFFVDSSGRFRIIGTPGMDKAKRIQWHLDRMQARPEDVMFVDDTAENCKAVGSAMPGLRVYHCSTSTGLTKLDCQLILNFFSKQSQKRSGGSSDGSRTPPQSVSSACSFLEASVSDGRRTPRPTERIERRCTSPMSSPRGGLGSRSPAGGQRATLPAKAVRRRDKAIIPISSPVSHVILGGEEPIESGESELSKMFATPNKRALSGRSPEKRSGQSPPRVAAQTSSLSGARASLGSTKRNFSRGAQSVQGQSVMASSFARCASPPSRLDSSVRSRSISSIPVSGPTDVRVETSNPLRKGTCMKHRASSPPSVIKSKRSGTSTLGGA